MYYRAIKMKNGGEEAKYRHFELLENAYTWLIPSEEKQQREYWHIKSLDSIMALCNEWETPTTNVRACNVEVVGWNEMGEEMTLYVQQVHTWQDALPQF